MYLGNIDLNDVKQVTSQASGRLSCGRVVCWFRSPGPGDGVGRARGLRQKPGGWPPAGFEFQMLRGERGISQRLSTGFVSGAGRACESTGC